MEKVFADVIKLQILKCVPPELLDWALNPMTSALVREKQRERLQGPKRRQRGLEGGRGSGDEAAGAGRPAAERQALRGAGMGGRGHAAAPARLPTSGFGLGNDSALGVSDLPLL